jgi:hypothetical protein
MRGKGHDEHSDASRYRGYVKVHKILIIIITKANVTAIEKVLESSYSHPPPPPPLIVSESSNN